MTQEQWEELRKTAYQAKLWLLKKNKDEAIQSAEQELDNLVEKLDSLKPTSES